jgi:hypothetical protein
MIVNPGLSELLKRRPRSVLPIVPDIFIPGIYPGTENVGDSFSAEDLTQDVFIRIWDKIGSFKGKSAFFHLAIPPFHESVNQKNPYRKYS